MLKEEADEWICGGWRRVEDAAQCCKNQEKIAGHRAKVSRMFSNPFIAPRSLRFVRSHWYGDIKADKYRPPSCPGDSCADYPQWHMRNTLNPSKLYMTTRLHEQLAVG